MFVLERISIAITSAVSKWWPIIYLLNHVIEFFKITTHLTIPPIDIFKYDYKNNE